MKVIAQHHTAILIFARSSEEELRHKKIRKGHLLFDTLTQHTLKEVQKTDLPFYHFSETQQEGRSFGERFANAIQHVFDKGYDRIITIGNDSPHLTHLHIEKATIALRNQRMVIGPSSDGGFYLMGLHRQDFQKETFQNLSWQTATIRQEVMELILPKEQKALALPQLLDIDSLWDVMTLTRQPLALSKKLGAIIRSIIRKNTLPTASRNARPISLSYSFPPNKGSPVPLLS